MRRVHASGVDGRRRKILALLARQDTVSTTELCRTFGVSEVSIRKDLDYLDKKGLAHRTHGGARIADATSPVLALVDRYMENRRAKEAIARQAVTLLDRADLRVYLDTGTTVLQLARQVPWGQPLLVYTNSLTTISALERTQAAQVILLGGRVDYRTRSATGSMFEALVDTLRFDLCFLGAESVSVEGFGCADIETADSLRRVISRSARVCVLADSSKTRRRNSALYASPGEAGIWITNAPAPAAIQRAMADGGVTVVVAASGRPKK